MADLLSDPEFAGLRHQLDLLTIKFEKLSTWLTESRKKHLAVDAAPSGVTDTFKPKHGLLFRKVRSLFSFFKIRYRR